MLCPRCLARKTRTLSHFNIESWLILPALPSGDSPVMASCISGWSNPFRPLRVFDSKVYARESVLSQGETTQPLLSVRGMSSVPNNKVALAMPHAVGSGVDRVFWPLPGSNVDILNQLKRKSNNLQQREPFPQLTTCVSCPFSKYSTFGKSSDLHKSGSMHLHLADSTNKFCILNFAFRTAKNVTLANRRTLLHTHIIQSVKFKN